MDLSNLQQSVQSDRQQVATGQMMRNVYGWMTAALCITAITSLIMAKNDTWVMALVQNTGLFIGLCIAEFLLVLVLSARITKMSMSSAMLMFMLYSVLNGVVLSSVMLVYTSTSIASTFFVTAGMYAAMALIGTFTKRDLSGLGRFCLMALIGLLLATIVNIFIASSAVYWIVTYAGVLIFCGLTAYDASKIRQMAEEVGDDTSEMSQKLAVLGALTMYLDFINLFLFLLRIFGRRD